MSMKANAIVSCVNAGTSNVTVTPAAATSGAIPLTRSPALNLALSPLLTATSRLALPSISAFSSALPSALAFTIAAWADSIACWQAAVQSATLNEAAPVCARTTSSRPVGRWVSNGSQECRTARATACRLTALPTDFGVITANRLGAGSVVIST